MRLAKITVTAFTLLAVLGACGTRVKVAQPTGVTAESAATPLPNPPVGDSAVSAPTAGDDAAVTGGTPPAPAAGGFSTGAGSAPASSRPPAGAATSARPGSSPGQAGAAPASQGSDSGPAAAPSPAPGGSADPGVAPAAPAAAPGVPVVVATVGTFSGPVGAVELPVLNGVQLWIKQINARGGLKGHPVKQFVYDDAGDPARHRSQVQDAVEQRKAVAFVANGDTLTGAGSLAYLAQKRVPVIGSDGGGDFNYDSPMRFPQMSSGEPWVQTIVPSLLSQPAVQGKKKLGSIICVEATTCDVTAKTIESDAKAMGFDYVSRSRTSVAQPDFTAECLGARNAGAEVLYVVLDENSVGRVRSSCTRQGYDPIYAILGQSQGEKQATSGFEQLLASTAVFPYFQTGTPATNEFAAAVASAGKGLTPSSGLAAGWTAGKLLEKAGLNLVELTSAAVLDGLWSIKDETLSGLTHPLTFVRDQKPSPKSCWFNMTVSSKKWVSPDAYQLHCR